MSEINETQRTDEQRGASRDGLAAVAMILLTVLFIVFVVSNIV